MRTIAALLHSTCRPAGLAVLCAALAGLRAQAVLGDPLALGDFSNPGPAGPFEREGKPFGGLPDEVSASFQAARLQGGAPFTFALAKDSHVSLNITRPDGWVVRELLVDALLKTGEHQAFWDGRDNYGRPLPAGDYRWRMLTHDGLRWDYIASVGNGGTPPWKTADNTGGWGGNHGSIFAVATDATGVYIAWDGVEGPFAYLKRTPDGSKGLWGGHLGPYEGFYHLASDGKHLYGVNGKWLRKLDIRTGTALTLGGEKNETGVEVDLKPAPGEKEPLYESAASVPGAFSAYGHPEGKGLVWGLAAGNGRVFMSVPWQNVIQVFDADNLARKPAEDIRSVKRPRNLVFVPPDHLFVSTEKAVYAIDLRTGRASPVVTDAIRGGFALTVARDGALFVSDLVDETVKKFAPDGKLLAALGKPARPPVLVPDYYGDILSLAAAPDGTVWFVQTIARRVGRMNADGKLLGHAIGGVNYAAATAPNPLNPNEVFSTMFYPVSALIDYEKQGVSTLAYRYFGDPPMTGGVFRLGGQYGFDNLVARNGKLFAFCADRLLEVVDTGPGVKACAHWDFGGISVRCAPFAKSLNLGNPPKGKRWMTLWFDRNGDGVPQADEIAFPAVSRDVPGRWNMAPDFSLYAAGFNWKPRSFTAGGAPEFNPDDIVRAAAAQADERWIDAGPSVCLGASGRYYGFENGTDPITPAGDGFWSGRCGLCSVIGYDATWKPLWQVGTKALQAAKPGQMYYLWSVAGEAQNCGLVGDVERVFHVVHKDGFYVQRILQDPRLNPPAGPDVLNVENFSGRVFTHPATGKSYLYASSCEASHVFEILGLTSIRVGEPQSLTLSDPAVPKAVVEREARHEYAIARIPSASKPASAFGGYFFPVQGIDWMRDVPAIPLRRNGRLVAETRIGYTDTALHLCTVLAAGGFKPRNGTVTVGEGRDRRSVLGAAAFGQGDSLEIDLGFDPKADPKRTAPVNGDARILVTARNDKGELAAYVMHPVHPFGRQAADAATFMENATPVDFDSVRAVGNARLYRLSPGGQTVIVVSVPFASLDLFDLLSKKEESTDELGIGPVARPAASGGTPGTAAKPPAWVNLDGRRIGLDLALTLADPRTGKRERIALGSGDMGGIALRPATWAAADCEASQAAPAEQEVNAVRLSGGESPVIDGNDAEWRANSKFDRNVVIPGPAGAPVGWVKLAWDDKAFYARVKVADDSPLKNNAVTPELLLKGGDAVAFCFGAGPASRKILMAKVGAAMRVTVYRPVSAEKRPYTFKSPAGEVALDYVAAEPRVRAAAGAGRDGYVVEAAIPWEVIGQKPAPGAKLPFDIQLVFSDPSGTADAYNAWWHSRSAEAAAVDDLPTEAKLYPAQWGTLVLE